MNEPYILFQVDDANYVVPAEQVQQVEIVERITRVPNAPDFVQGIVYLRGQVVPVINVRRRFHLPEIPSDPRTRLIVTRLENRLVGLLVDSAREFLRLDDSTLQPLPAGVSGPGSEYLRGVFSLPNRLVLLVDLQRLLNPQEKEALTGDLQTPNPS